MTQPRRYRHKTLLAALSGLVVCAMPLASLARAQDNPWAPRADQPARPAAPAPTLTEKPKYYQEPTMVQPQALSDPDRPSRFAPDDLDQRLATGLPLGSSIPGTGVPGLGVPQPPLAGALQTPFAPPVGAVPGRVPGAVPAPGYAAGSYLPGYATGHAPYGYPITPYGGPGYPGNYGGYWPLPGTVTSGPIQGFDFAPFGFW